MHSSTRHLFLSCALAAFSVGVTSAATISLDDAGTDPILTTPFFSFPIDQAGMFSDQFTNMSDPATDFTFLQLTATFSSTFWFSTAGPPTVGAFCDGRDAFNSCSINIQASTFTLVFTFTGLDDTHHGLPFEGILGIMASSFEPGQIITAAAVVPPPPTPRDPSIPEPSSVGLAGIGILLLFVGVRRRQVLKLRARS
jgi:PEP-CTERM motif